PALELFQVEPETRLLAQRDGHGDAADEVDDRLVDRESRVRVDDLVAGIHEGHDREEHDRLTARRDHDLFRRDGHAARRAHVLANRLAELGQPGGGPVVRGTLVEGALGGVADVTGCVEVRLTDLEVDDLATRALQRLGPRENLERGFRPEPRHARGDVHGISPGRALYGTWSSWSSRRC